jgi:hypothetical protein
MCVRSVAVELAPTNLASWARARSQAAARESVATKSILAEQAVFETLNLGQDARLRFFGAIQPCACHAE